MQGQALGGRLSRRAVVGSLAGLAASAAGLMVLERCGLIPGVAATHARIGVLTAGMAPSAPEWQAFLASLREYGWVEGQNLVLDWRVDVDPASHARNAAELVRVPVDLIVTNGAAAPAAKAATATIPIVFPNIARPVESGLVSSLARPGGNITGVAASAPEGTAASLPLKVLDLAWQVVPALMRVCYLSSAPAPVGQLGGLTSTDLRRGGAALGLQVQTLPVRAADELEAAFAAANEWGAQALLADTPALFASFGFERVPQLAARQRLPDFYFPNRAPVDAGGLMSYGPNQLAQYRRAAYFVDRILRGAKPADLPIEQPSIYELVVNSKTAQALGLTIPPDVAAQVTEWVE